MSRKSNDNIEEFFKKGVRKSDITFRESDWQKMERMLDEKAMVGSASTSRPLKRIIGAVVVAALLSSIYFLIPDGDKESSPDKKSQVAANTEQSEVAAASINDELSNSINKAKDEQRQGHEKIESQSQTKETGANKEPVVTESRANSQRAASGESVNERNAAGNRNTTSTQPKSTRSASSSQKLTASEYEAAEKVNDESIQSVRTIPDNNVDRNADTAFQQADEEQVTSRKQALGDQSTPVVERTSPERSTSNVNADRSKYATTATNDSDKNSAIQKDSVEIAKEEEKVAESAIGETKTQDDDHDKTITPSRWNVAFVFAPEFSSTSFDKQTVPGSAYGLTIGYRIINRLTITTGIIKTYKKYVGYGEDYQPPAGYWQFKTNGIVPDEVSGQCSVIEIPLVLQYDLLQREKFRLFAAGGVSSYRMLNEKYDYTFNEPNDGAADGWSTDTPSSYYFSVGHLSVGYDRRLYRGLSLGIEPYAKIPFGGIGWSNVNLLTMGAYVNMRYTFSKRN